jgi:hypothetical protein
MENVPGSSLLITFLTKKSWIKLETAMKSLIRFRLRDRVTFLEFAKSGVNGQTLVKTTGASYFYFLVPS